MKSQEFKQELQKIMPGYKWSVHRVIVPGELVATGTQSSGFNRLSTLCVERRDRDGVITYLAKSSGYGAKSPWLASATGGTLAQSLRALQDEYEHMASTYLSHASALKNARKV